MEFLTADPGESLTTGMNSIRIETLASLGISFLFGLAILLVYVISNRHKKLDDSLTEVIPLLTVLMSVMMHIDSSVQAVTFFGIFGVLSIVRFRSVLTEQKGITFILFAVIMGILVGSQQYTLSVLAYVTLSLMVLTIPRLLPTQQFFLLTCRFAEDHLAAKRAIIDYITACGLRYKIVSTSGQSATRGSGKVKAPVMELEIEIRRPRHADIIELYTGFNHFAEQSNISIHLTER